MTYNQQKRHIDSWILQIQINRRAIHVCILELDNIGNNRRDIYMYSSELFGMNHFVNVFCRCQERVQAGIRTPDVDRVHYGIK